MSRDISPRTVSLLEASDSEVYLAILERIQRGEVGVDDRIVDTALATEFGLSRMPVRQALLRLVHEGYLAGTTRGFVLPRLSDQDITEIFEVRMLLEPRAAAAACQVLGDGQIDEMRKHLAAAKHAVARGDSHAMMQANDKFRQVWLKAVPNRRLAASIGRFVDHVQIVRRATVIDVSVQHLILQLLADLLRSFSRRDVLEVQDLTAQFVAKGKESFFALGRGEVEQTSDAA